MTEVPRSDRFYIAAAFLVVALLFGGGGSPAPLAELVVQIAAIVALGTWAVRDLGAPRAAVSDRVLWSGVGLLAAIPLLQLVPLPPAIWHALPGRDVEQAALHLIHRDTAWRPLSVAPYRTLASLLSLLPPIAIIYFVSQLDLIDRTRLLVVATAVVLLAAAVGVLQIASGTAGWLRFYPNTADTFETGFQANRNATADVLLIGIAMLTALMRLLGRRTSVASRLTLFAFTALFLALSVVLTGSRAGTVLLVLPALLALALLRPRIRWSRSILLSAVAAVFVVGALGVTLKDNVAIDRTLQRFTDTRDARPDLWQDTRYAIAQVWPVGAGVGTFTTVFPAAERLEVIDQFTANRAHNDYLEFALEAGLGGVVAIVAGIVALAVRGATILRAGLARTAATHAILGTGILGILALHSLLDYPMRSMSLAVLGGLAVALLSRSPRSRDVTGRPID